MKLEAVTVCVGYDDFLIETIPYNAPLIDRWVIVTSKADTKTQEVCRRNGLYCMVTDAFFQGGDEFNKGRGILRGLDQLASDGWVLHLDADMVLPRSTRQALEAAYLDPENIYGCDRAMVKGWEQWQRLKASGFLTHDYHCRVNFPPGLPVGARWASEAYGYVPIGAFQLWYGKSDLYKGIHTKPYPARHNDAARSDIQHGLQWDRRNRVLLPEVIAIHLESEPSPLGVNWAGRKTKRFHAP